MMQVAEGAFVDGFADAKDILHEFNAAVGDLENAATVLYACYTYEDYEGNALVLFESGGKLYEVSGGHCSCHGLEDQWEPAEISWEYLNNRKFYGLGGDALEQMRKLIAEHVKEAQAS